MPNHPIKVSHSPERLFREMAGDIDKVKDPWARHWIVGCNRGSFEFVLQAWANRRGAATHSQFLELRALIEQVAATPAEIPNSAPRPAPSPPFSIDRLTFLIAQKLPGMDGLPLPPNLISADHPADAKVLSWAKLLAEALDIGLLCRPDEMPKDAAPFLKALAEDADIQQELAKHLAEIDPQAFARSAEAWMRAWEARGGIPHLWIHLDAGLPEAIFRKLRILLEALPTGKAGFYLLFPCQEFWGDLGTGKRRQIKNPWGQDAGPILKPFGRCAQDLLNQVIEPLLGEGAGEEALECETGNPDSLLARLKTSCITASAPENPAAIADDDRSVSVHSCRSPVRELEVCRDVILRALREIPGLRPQDVQVLLADPEKFAPFVVAAFQPQGEQAQRLPVRMVGIGRPGSSRFAGSLELLLGAMNRRLGLPEIQALLEDPLVAEKFEFDRAAEDRADLVGWLKDAQFRWGLDAADRGREQGIGEERWSLAFALRRLALGAVVARERRDGVVAGAAPLDRAHGLSVALLANLARFAERLDFWRCEWARPKSAKDWKERTARMVEDFLGNGDRVAQEHRAKFLGEVLPKAETLPETRITADAWQRWLKEKLESLLESKNASGGGVTVADLRAHAGTPARMILVAGLGAENFPRREERPGWHPLANARRAGDPDRRDADRHALLLAFLACKERLVFTYQGKSDVDDKGSPPSTPLADFLAAVDKVSVKPSEGRAHQKIVFHHGLNGFTPGDFAEEGSRNSMLLSDFAGAAALLAGSEQDFRFGSPLPATPPGTIALKDLKTLLEEPCKLFLARLGIRLPEEEEELAEGDFLEPDGLENWGVRKCLIDARLRGEQAADLKTRMEKAGQLPKGKFGEKVWEDANRKINLPEGKKFAPFSQDILLEVKDADGSPWKIEGALGEGWYRAIDETGAADGPFYFFSASKKSTKHELRLKLEALCLSVHLRKAIAVHACFSGSKNPYTFEIQHDREKIISGIQKLVPLYGLALRIPLPFWSQIYEKSRAAAEGQALRQEAEKQWLSESDYGGETAPREFPATRVAFRGLDNPIEWKPDFGDCEPEFLPNPDEELASRLIRFVSGWENALPLAVDKKSKNQEK